MNANRRFLEALAIEEPRNSEDWTVNVASTQMEFTRTAATERVQVNVGSLCSFSKELSVRNREDVINSTLLAQLAANRAYDRFLEQKDWYNFYTNVLGQIGWNVSSLSFGDISPKTPINWEDLALQGFAVFGDMEPAKKAIEMAKALTMNSKAMKIWSKNASNGNNGNFQIISFMPVNGTVVARTSSLIFQSTMSQEQFLSWSTNFTIERTSFQAELIEDIYGKIRQMIIDKLGDARMTNVASVP